MILLCIHCVLDLRLNIDSPYHAAQVFAGPRLSPTVCTLSLVIVYILQPTLSYSSCGSVLVLNVIMKCICFYSFNLFALNLVKLLKLL